MCLHIGGVSGAPEAGEDLPADRVVPVAEGTADGRAVGCPRATAQHPVLVAKEDLGVLAVRECDESGWAAEVAGRPLPNVADELVHTERRGAVRVRADRCRLKVRAAQIRMPGFGVGVAPWVPAGAARRPVPPARPPPPRPRP